jgi:hypothetical protein
MDDASPPCLVYLFADLMLPEEGHWHHAMGDIAVPVPRTDTLVALGALERLMVAVAIWDLERSGAMRVVLGPTPSVKVGEGGIPRGGLEEQLVDAVPPDGCTLWQLIMALQTKDATLPLNAIVAAAQAEAVNLGIIDQPRLPELIPGFLGHHTFPTVSVHAQYLGGQRAAFKRLAKDWAQAVQGKTVWSQLSHQCGAALFDARPAARLVPGPIVLL